MKVEDLPSAIASSPDNPILRELKIFRFIHPAMDIHSQISRLPRRPYRQRVSIATKSRVSSSASLKTQKT
jgi:hypothetical protein